METVLAPNLSVTCPMIPCLLSVAKIALSTGGVRMLHLRLFLLFALLSAGAYAQWLNYPTPGTPRTRDGKPNLTAPAPRASDGKPDLSGVWQTELVNPRDSVLGENFQFVVPGDDPRTFSKYFLNILADFKPEEAPIRPEAAALTRKRAESQVDPTTHCLT